MPIIKCKAEKCNFCKLRRTRSKNYVPRCIKSIIHIDDKGKCLDMETKKEAKS